MRKLDNVQRRVILLIGLLANVAAGCGAKDPGVTAVGSQRDSGGFIPTESTQPGDTVPPERTYEVIDGVVDFGEAGPQHPQYDGFLTAAFNDIQEFWAQAFPETYGAPWEPLSGGIYAAYPGRQAPIPGCGEDVSNYDDVQGNAFYCIAGDFMAYDDSELLPGLVDLLGKEAVAVAIAHEFGHAIQARAGEWTNPTVLKEQQADCFAGAWAAHVASGGSDVIAFDDAAVRAGLVAMIYVRDPIEGEGLADPNAHGTGFDRVGAFQDGFIGGATRCQTFFTEDRLSHLVDIPFDYEDPNAGNLPLIDPAPDPTNGPSDIVTLLPLSLQLFWAQITAANSVAFTPPTVVAFPTAGPFPSCAGIDEVAYKGNVVFCPSDNTIYWDQDVMFELSSNSLTGDMSVGYLFSNAYSEAVQTALGSTRTSETRALFDDCLTGAWVAYIVPGPGGVLPDDGRQDTLQLSAGDLDEAIVTAIARSDLATDTNVVGSAFEKIDAFRKGVLGGLNVCT